jgi:preprotein translocase subunit SecF
MSIEDGKRSVFDTGQLRSNHMELIKPGINIDFIGKRKIAFVFSIALIMATVFLLILRGGPNLGVDFSGGVVVQVKLETNRTIAEIKEALASLNLQDSIVQEFGEGGELEYLIRVRRTDIELEGLGEKIKESLNSQLGEEVEIRKVDMVGAKVGQDLKDDALSSIFYAILLIAVYISGRFELKWLMSIVMALSLVIAVLIMKNLGASVVWLIVIALIVTIGLCWGLKLKYAMGAVIALVHDVTITVGAFALTDREISLAIIAAFLTIVGYSLNDTIVVFDRIRENLRRFRRRGLEEVINSSINETLSRTLLTSTTTLIVVLALFILGGGVIHDFAFAMLVGILVGTYSSIFVASPILLAWKGSFARKGKAKES